MMYKMIATSNTSPPDKRRRLLEDSRSMLRESPLLALNSFYPEGYQLGFDFAPEGNVYLTAPLCVRYFWGSPDNELDKIITGEEMFYERRSGVPKVVRDLWLKLSPPRKLGLYVEV